MARNRMIKPTFWTSKTLMRVSRDSRLLFIGLWNFADDYGILEDSNRRILGDVFPYDETVNEKDIAKWKGELLKEKLLVEIHYNGHSYIYVRSWDEHQAVPHPGKETIPKNYIQESLMRPSGDSHSQIEIEIKREIIMSEETSDEEKNFSENSDEFFLASLLFQKIKENNPKAKKPNLQKWSTEISKLIRIDHRTFEEIEFIISWSQKDTFWKSNILSTAKLREKFDQLFVKALSQWEQLHAREQKKIIPNFSNPYAKN